MKSKIEIIGILVMVFILFVLIPLSFSIMKIFAQDITVYNFSSITNPSTTHIAWNGTDTGLPPSNLILLTENELKDVNYDKLDNSDNTRIFHFSGTASRYASQKFRFQIKLMFRGKVMDVLVVLVLVHVLEVMVLDFIYGILQLQLGA